jgi:hypothetical protein
LQIVYRFYYIKPLNSDLEIKPTKADNQMRRNFSHPRSGNFCIKIEQLQFKNLKLHYKLLNLDSNLVEGQGRVEKNQLLIEIAFGVLRAGNYQLTLQDISQDILVADLCSSKSHFMNYYKNHNSDTLSIQVKVLIRI